MARSVSICDLVKVKCIYMLEELDVSRLASTFAGNRLKKFHPWQRLLLDHPSDLGDEEIITLDDFLTGDDNNDLFDAPANLSDAPDTFWNYSNALEQFFFLLFGFQARVSFFFCFGFGCFFLVSWDDILVGGNVCDGVRCAYLRVGRFGSWVAKVMVKNLLAQAGNK